MILVENNFPQSLMCVPDYRSLLEDLPESWYRSMSVQVYRSLFAGLPEPLYRTLFVLVPFPVRPVPELNLHRASGHYGTSITGTGLPEPLGRSTGASVPGPGPGVSDNF